MRYLKFSNYNAGSFLCSIHKKSHLYRHRRKRKNSDTLEYLKIALLNCRKYRLEKQLEVMAPKIKATCESGFTFYYSVKNSTQADEIDEKHEQFISDNQNVKKESNNVSDESNLENQDWDPLEPFKTLGESAKNISSTPGDLDDSDVVQAYQLLQELMVSANAADSIISKNKITNDPTSTICTDTLLMLKLASTTLNPQHMLDQRIVL